MLAYTYPLADLFGTMLGFFVLIIWFWLLIIVFSDIFRSHDMGAGQKRSGSSSSSSCRSSASSCT